MKNRFLLIVLIAVMSILFVSCASNGAYDYSGSASDSDISYYKDGGESYSKKESSGDVGEGWIDVDPSGESGGKDNNQIQAGQLSAAAYDDNEHYQFWKTLLTKGQSLEDTGIFYNYYNSFKESFITLYRIKLSFSNGVPEKVVILNNDQTTFTAYPRKNGDCYLFPKSKQDSYDISIYYYLGNEEKVYNDVISGDKDYDMFLIDADLNASNQKLYENAIDIMFVIDTTGSMGDEMFYIESELSDVIERVADSNPNATIRVAIMIYRDTSDAYITRFSDFTTEISKQINFLKTQSANGGGDFEEAVEVALSEAVAKKWSDTASTKLLIHVADAPAHDEKVSDWSKAVNSLNQLGIKIITIASSGIDKKTEYFFRCQSMITGGIYTYITNDSGIGGDHIVATTENSPTVEYLNSMLVRLINGFHTGTFAEPVPYKNEPSEQ